NRSRVVAADFSRSRLILRPRRGRPVRLMRALGRNMPQEIADSAKATRQEAAPRAGRTTRKWIPLVLVLATLLTMGRVGTCDFVTLDDHCYVTQNPHVQGGLCRQSISWALTSIEYANWHPLTWLSLELDYSLYGLNPAGFHVTNLILHVVNTLLLYW